MSLLTREQKKHRKNTQNEKCWRQTTTRRATKTLRAFCKKSIFGELECLERENVIVGRVCGD